MANKDNQPFDIPDPEAAGWKEDPDRPGYWLWETEVPVTEAPVDGIQYGRQDASWTEIKHPTVHWNGGSGGISTNASKAIVGREDNEGVGLYASGRIAVWETGQNNNRLWNGYGAGSVTSYIQADGDAKFSGNVDLLAVGRFGRASLGFDTNLVFARGSNDLPTGVDLGNDSYKWNNATFAGTVTANSLSADTVNANTVNATSATFEGDVVIKGELLDENGDPAGGGSGPEVEVGSELGQMLTWRTDRWEKNNSLRQYGDAVSGKLFDYAPYTSTGSGGTPADSNRRADFRVRSNEGDARLTAATQVGKASVEFVTGEDSLTSLASIWSHTGSYGDFRAGELVFETGDTPRVTITADGKVGIGEGRPTALLHVEGVNSQCAQFRGESYELINVNFGSGTAEFDIRNTTTFHIKRSGTSAIAIDGSANCTFSKNVTAPDFVATSDERVKDNISTAPVGIIDSLKGREWDWAESGEKGSGVVAQELEQVLPHLVHTDDEGMKSVAYNGLLAYLIEEVKSLRAELEALK